MPWTHTFLGVTGEFPEPLNKSPGHKHPQLIRFQFNLISIAWHNISWMIAIDVASALIIGSYSIDCLYLRIKLKQVICFVACCILAKTQRTFFSLTTCPSFISIAYIKWIRQHRLYDQICIHKFFPWIFYAMFFWISILTLLL